MTSSSPESSRCGRVLLVDDVQENLALLSRALEPEGYEIMVAGSGAVALKLALKARPDIILLDVMLPEMDGFEICRRLKEEVLTRDIPVIFLTARNETEAMVQGFRAGGVDYIVKPFQIEEVVTRASTHLRLSRLTRELQEKNHALEARTLELSAEIERRRQVEADLKQADEHLSTLSGMEAARWNLSGLVGGSAHMQRLLGDIHKLHQFNNTSVLITGESGTGKELIARAIHFGGSRSKAPFVPVNCVAIPADLAESMLFGHVKGAFTGALTDRKGCFEMAHGGALFLDEIGDMPVSLQVKLLRVLEDGYITPVGASQPKKVDVRIIAATNADLQGKIASGQFRQDLFFRLARYNLQTQPLRSCLEDIPMLAGHFIRQFASEMGFRPPELSEGAVALLKQHDFPGNVRELKNIIERALIESGGSTIQPEHLQLMPARLVEKPVPDGKSIRDTAASLPLNLSDAEDILIQRALQETGGNIADAARMLGVHRTRIYRKLAAEEGAPTA